MPQPGFKAITIDEDHYALAKKMADKDETSIAKLVSKALESYLNRRLKMEDKVRIICEVLETMESA